MHDEELLYYSLKRIASILKESSTTPKQLMIHNIMYFLLLAWNASKVPVCCFLQ